MSQHDGLRVLGRPALLQDRSAKRLPPAKVSKAAGGPRNSGGGGGRRDEGGPCGNSGAGRSQAPPPPAVSSTAAAPPRAASPEPDFRGGSSSSVVFTEFPSNVFACAKPFGASVLDVNFLTACPQKRKAVADMLEEMGKAIGEHEPEAAEEEPGDEGQGMSDERYTGLLRRTSRGCLPQHFPGFPGPLQLFKSAGLGVPLRAWILSFYLFARKASCLPDCGVGSCAKRLTLRIWLAWYEDACDPAAVASGWKVDRPPREPADVAEAEAPCGACCERLREEGEGFRSAMEMVSELGRGPFQEMKAMSRPPAAVAQLGRALEPIWGRGRLKALLV